MRLVPDGLAVDLIVIFLGAINSPSFYYVLVQTFGLFVYLHISKKWNACQGKLQDIRKNIFQTTIYSILV